MAKIALVLAAVTFVIVGLGQGCSKSPAVGIFSHDSGNGGIYGGLTPSYTPYSGSLIFPLLEINPTIKPYFYLAGQHTGCSNYPSGYESVGPDVVGMISFGNNGVYYAPSLCDSSNPISLPEINVVAFDQAVAIFHDQIYVHVVGSSSSSQTSTLLNTSPPQASDLLHPSAYCRKASKDSSGIDYGTDVLIYENGGKLYAVVNGAVNGNNGPEAFSVPAFIVTTSNSSSQYAYSAESFSLDVVRNGSPTTTGTLNIVMEGAPIILDMVCWLSTL